MASAILAPVVSAFAALHSPFAATLQPVASGRAATGLFAGPSSRSAIASLPARRLLPRVQRLKSSGRPQFRVEATSASGPAGASPSSGSNDFPLAPLEPASPTGLLLNHLLKTSPHLFTPAVEEQLVRLAEEKESQGGSAEEADTSDKFSLALRRRIKEVKEAETQRAIEDAMYAMIVQRFTDMSVKLLPPLVKPKDGEIIRNVQADLTNSEKLATIHSRAAQELLKQHMAVVLGTPTKIDGLSNMMAQIPRSRVSQVYAASLMFGYFLRRVDARFQLESNLRRMSVLDVDEGEEVENTTTALAEQNKLKKFVQKMDVGMLQRTASLSTKEGMQLVERHMLALFGPPPVVEPIESSTGVVQYEDNVITISISALRCVVMEAVAFGGYLFDIESAVERVYPLTPMTA